MIQIGIWLDKIKAHIVTLNNEQTSIYTLFSNIEDTLLHDGSRAWSKSGPNEVVMEKRNLEREKHQFKRFFKNLAIEINRADAIVLFGPAETAQKFKDELLKHYKSLALKVKAVSKADSMTENQIIAWVKDFYKSA